MKKLQENRLFALVFRSVAILLCLAGILDVFGLFGGEFRPQFLLYYTLQSNLLVLVLFGFLIYKTAKDFKKQGKTGSSSYYPRASALALVAIILTFVVYWGLLAPAAAKENSLWTFYNLQVHAITPLLLAFDYFFFTKPGHLNKKDPLLFALIPLLYLVQATILGLSGVVYSTLTDGTVMNFPYAFMNYYSTGWWVAAYIAGIALFIFGLGYLLVFIDKARSRKSK